MKYQDLIGSKQIAMTVIIFVSVVAFLAGALQGQYLSKAEESKETLIGLEDEFSSTERLANSILLRDLASFAEADGHLADAKALDVELAGLNDTLDDGNRTMYHDKIIAYMDAYHQTMAGTVYYQLFDAFYSGDEPGNSVGIIDGLHYGYDFRIYRETWDNLSLGTETRTAGEVVNDFFSNETIDERLEHLEFLPEPPIWWDLKKLYDSPVIRLRDEMNDLRKEVNLNERSAGSLNLGISIATVVILLSSAMANRITERKNEQDLAVIRADITKDESLARTSRDLISVPVLLLVTVLIVVGTLFPMILVYFSY
ncbi:MAG: hypothetical protein ACFFD4_35255 [Candidatus Odinarchaeota archaeon]